MVAASPAGPGTCLASVNIRDDHLEDMLRHRSPFPLTRKSVSRAGEYSRRLAAFLTEAGYDAASLAGGVMA